LTGEWSAQSDVFCLVTSADLSRTELAEEEKAQADRLRAMKIDFFPIDLKSLSERLKPHPDLVDDFFGREYVHRFCGVEAAAQLQQKRKLTSAQASELRKKLRLLYSQQFQSTDPGLPTVLASRPGEKLPLNLSRRYIPIDVYEQRELIRAKAIRPRPTGSSDPSSSSHRDPQTEGRINKDEYRTRRPLFQSLLGFGRVLIMGDPGSGKSASLRFLTLDLLADMPTQGQLAAKWGDRLPVWVPFAAWTRIVANQRPQHALSDVLKEWLHNIAAPEAVIALVMSALEDERLLLLVDGLDEWSNETAAGTALSLLNTFVDSAHVPVIASARPLGFERLAAGLGAWEVVELAGLNEEQREQFARSWFDFYLECDTNGTRTESVSSQRTKQFLVELRRDNGIARISQIPLLLTGLIGLSLSGWQLPRNRFVAYAELTKLLVETHPALRKAASMATVGSSSLSTEETYRAFARLAFAIQESPGAVAVPQETARQTVIEHLRDRLGPNRSDLAEKADELLRIGADSIGILVEKTNDDIGFFHRTLQEFLAARHLHVRPVAEQRAVFEQKVSDAAWHEVLLCLCHQTQREDEVDMFISLFESATLEPFEAFQRERLLAEIAFGDLHATSLKSQQLATRIFRCIETHWWMPLRKALLDTVIDGLNSTPLRQSVIEKLREWFPDPVSYRSGLYDILAGWPYEAETVQTIISGLREDDEWNQKLAAYALAKYAGGKEEVGSELLSLATSPVSADVAAASLLALSSGWPNLQGLTEILTQATQSRSTALRLAGNIGLINIGKRDEKLREDLLKIANVDAANLFRWEDEIANGLVIGWPRDESIKKVAMDSVSKHWQERNRILKGVAGKILLDGYPQDDEIATLIAEQIKTEHGIYFGGSGSFWEHLAKNFSQHPKIVASVKPWLERKEFVFGFDLYHAAICTKAPELKAELLLKLKKPEEMDTFWIIEALLDAWGASDPEVSAALQEFAPKTSGDDSLGDTVLRLPVEPEEQKRRLLAALHGQNSGRRFSVIAALGQLPNDLKTDEVVEAVLAASQRPIWQEGGSERSAAILQFTSNPKVKNFAISELHLRNSQVGAVAAAYGNDPAMRKLVRTHLNQLPVILRLQIVERLESMASQDDDALQILSDYDAESDEGVKVSASCAYYTALRSRQRPATENVTTLQQTLSAIGHDCTERRQAALFGLAALGRLDIAVAAVERHESKPANFRFAAGTQTNLEVVRRLAILWPAFMAAFGESVWQRIPLEGNMAGEMLAFAEDEEAFRALSQRWEQNPESERGTPTALRALARREPKSQRLRTLCIACLTASEPRMWWGNVAELIAASEIIGEEFGGDPELLKLLEKQADSGNLQTFITIALSIGWPDSPVLKRIANAKRPQPWYLPAEAYIACWGMSGEDLLLGLKKVLASLEGSIWDFFPNTTNPLVARFRQDASIRTLAGQRVMGGGTSDEKATLLKILSRSGGLTPNLIKWAREELRRQISSPSLAELGCDLPGSAVRPVAHSILDILEGKAS
jgi:hypothetical protein